MTYYADENGNVYNRYGKKIKPQDNGTGYKQFSLMTDGKRKNVKIHRFVWEYFNGKIPKGYQIDHINNIKDDNRLDNLRIVTPKVNIRRRSCNKLNLGKVRVIRLLYATGHYTTYKLADKYKVDQSLISRIINYKTWN